MFSGGSLVVGDMCVFAPQKSGSCAIMVGFSANPSLVAYAGCCLFLFSWDSLFESWWVLQDVFFGPVAAPVGGVWAVFAPHASGS